MPDTTPIREIKLESDEKATPVMAYTLTSFSQGTVISKVLVRVSTWLRQQPSPEYLHLYNAQVLLLSGSSQLNSISLAEYFVPASLIIAYHMMPPHVDPPDYDESEPNRKMEPVSVLFSSFRFNGGVRMAAQSDLTNYLEHARQTFTSLYDVEITNPAISSKFVLRVPFAMVRTNMVALATRG